MDIEDAFAVVGSMGRFQIFITLVNFSANIVYGYQMVLMVIVGATPNLDIPSEVNLTTIVTEWNLYEDQWVIDLISSLFMAGFAVGCVVFGQLSDLYGRKWLFIINYTILVLFSFCAAFCNSWMTFALMRTLSGLFAGGSGLLLFVLMLENIGKNTWALVGMIFQCFFSIGMILLSEFGYALQEWRKITMASSAFASVLIPIYIFIIPESARWLYHVGKVGKAESVLSYIAKWNGKPDEYISLSNINDNTFRHRALRKYSVIDLFRIPKLALYAVCSFYIWFACSLVYYGLTFDASTLSSDIYVAVTLSGAIEIPAIFMSYLLMRHKWFGRKGTTILLMVTSAISSIGLLFAAGVDSGNLSILETVFGLLSKLAVSGVFAILYIYISEVFPTQLRLVAGGGSSMFARLGAIIAPFVPLLVSAASYLPYVVFGVATALAAASTLYLPETLNKRVPDMSDFAALEDNWKKEIRDRDVIVDPDNASSTPGERDHLLG